MSKKKAETTIDLPPTWEEMREGQTNTAEGAAWSVQELGEAWGKCHNAALRMIHAKKWICVGKRRELAITGDVKLVPIYAPKE
jgi:hypothetical protein